MLRKSGAVHVVEDLDDARRAAARQPARCRSRPTSRRRRLAAGRPTGSSRHQDRPGPGRQCPKHVTDPGPKHRQDDGISPTGLSDDSGGSARAELGDQLSQGVRPPAVAEDNFVTSSEWGGWRPLGTAPRLQSFRIAYEVSVPAPVPLRIRALFKVTVSNGRVAPPAAVRLRSPSGHGAAPSRLTGIGLCPSRLRGPDAA